MKAIEGVNPKTDAPAKRSSSDEEPFSALAFKIATDPFVGNLTFIRVYSGFLTGDGVVNTVKDEKERIGRMVQMHSITEKRSKRLELETLLHVLG